MLHFTQLMLQHPANTREIDPYRKRGARVGPIVMNTQEEQEKAFEELDRGTFIKTKNWKTAE